ncbi:hypothetical protein D1871_04200 [Nakamurella silvestris]|nr:hypothetical protein D1871_04200 [Nakamurella silvestris]
MEVTTERVVSSGVAVEGTGHLLMTEIARMRVILGHLQGAWSSSEAAPQFVRALDGHLEAARVLARALLGHGAGLTEAGRSLAQVEAAIAQAVGGGHGAVGGR